MRLVQLTFACEDPAGLAAFWADMLDYEVEDRATSGGMAARDTKGEGPPLFFSRGPKSRTIEVPIHLDVNVPDREAAVARLLERGGWMVETKTHAIGTLEEAWTVMRDPEGNGFCVQQPPDVERPYVGNVTFSCAEPGTLARFWSQALDWPEEDPGDEFLAMLRTARLHPDEFDSYAGVRVPGKRPRFLFQRRQKSPTESIPLHPDFETDDRATEVERLIELGGSVVETKTGASGFTFTVMRDPEGNPFCVG